MKMFYSIIVYLNIVMGEGWQK